MQGALFETNIKYEMLDNMLNDYVTNIQYSNTINVYIDLKSVFKKVYRTDINNIIKEQKIIIEDITSHVINMIGFYRNYFYKKNKYTNVYLLYSEKECNNLQNKYLYYKKDFYNKYLNNNEEYKNLNNIIKTSVKLIKTIVKHLPHCFYIETSEFDEFCYLNYLVRNSGNSLNLILSSDIILYQTLNKNTLAIDLKGENSSLITSNNVIKYLIKRDTILTGNSLNLLLSITGDSDYSLPNIQSHSYKKAEKMLLPFFKNISLIDQTYMTFPNILLNNQLMKDNEELIKNNFQILFPIELQMTNENKIRENISISKIKTSDVSYNELKDLNQRIFLLFPINIGMLLKGEINA